MSCENPINLHASRKSISERHAILPEAMRFYLCVFHSKSILFCDENSFNACELILSHLTRMMGVFLRHLQYAKTYIVAQRSQFMNVLDYFNYLASSQQNGEKMWPLLRKKIEKKITFFSRLLFSQINFFTNFVKSLKFLSKNIEQKSVSCITMYVYVRNVRVL